MAYKVASGDEVYAIISIDSSTSFMKAMWYANTDIMIDNILDPWSKIILKLIEVNRL